MNILLQAKQDCTEKVDHLTSHRILHTQGNHECNIFPTAAEVTSIFVFCSRFSMIYLAMNIFCMTMTFSIQLTADYLHIWEFSFPQLPFLIIFKILWYEKTNKIQFRRNLFFLNFEQRDETSNVNKNTSRLSRQKKNICQGIYIWNDNHPNIALSAQQTFQSINGLWRVMVPFSVNSFLWKPFMWA